MIPVRVIGGIGTGGYAGRTVGSAGRRVLSSAQSATKLPPWERRYSRNIALTDVVVVVLAIFGAQALRFGANTSALARPVDAKDIDISYGALSVILAVVWLLALHLGDTRSAKVIGAGAVEYRRVIVATLSVFGTFAVVAYLFDLSIGRGYLLLALPLGLVALIATRFAWRKQLHRQRRHGKNVHRTLLVGEVRKSAHIYRQLTRDLNAGFEVVGVLAPQPDLAQAAFDGVPVAAIEELIETVDTRNVDTVIITGADHLHPERLQQIGWDLDERQVDLIVAAALTDIAGPRIHMRPAIGFPLIYVEYPRLTGARRFIKRFFDLVVAIALIVVTSPVMLAVGVAVKATSRGPVFYSQQRIGAHGNPFPMFKFRSMVQNADDQLASLLDAQGTSDKPLHKVIDDPRITPVGKFIRRYSLDELPQLFNVVLGTMSLVGPRPQREAEVALYEAHHHRRLLVKPGITGLWQVSGRSSLTWAEAIRLDLYYVENWSLIGDLVILVRTVRAVALADGAH